MRALLDVMADPGIDWSQFNDCDTAFHVAMADAAVSLSSGTDRRDP